MTQNILLIHALIQNLPSRKIFAIAIENENQTENQYENTEIFATSEDAPKTKRGGRCR